MSESQTLKDIRDQISILRLHLIHREGYLHSLNSRVYDLEKTIESLKDEIHTLGKVVYVGDCETED